MKKGLFISFEGGDGAGKSTQIANVKQFLEEEGYEVLLSREPGGTSIGEKIRGIILDKENMEMSPVTEAYLYAASRAQHVQQVIKPALEAGKIVICDRFIDSSVAYQGYGRGLGESVDAINFYAVDGCMPDLTILLKLPPETGKRRISTREEDRIELEALDFHEKVYRGYEAIERDCPDRVIGIDARGSIVDITAVIIGKLKDVLNGTK